MNISKQYHHLYHVLLYFYSAMSCKSLRTLILLKEKQVSNYILLD